MEKVGSKARVAVLGLGGIGGLLSALLWRNGYDVVAVVREISMDSLIENGLHIKSSYYGNFIAKPKVVSLLKTPVDVLFVCVKSPFLLSALDQIKSDSLDKGVVVPLLNGLGHKQVLINKFGASVALATIGSIEAFKTSSFSIFHKSKSIPHVEISLNENVLKSKVDNISMLLNDIGFSVNLISSEKIVIWNKFLRLNVIATLTAAFDKTVGELYEDEKSLDFLESIVDETITVASRDGIECSHAKLMESIMALPKNLRTSLQRDINSGQPSELRSITFAIIELANKFNIKVPAHEIAYNLILERKNQINKND